jgi:hypothetical protein
VLLEEYTKTISQMMKEKEVGDGTASAVADELIAQRDETKAKVASMEEDLKATTVAFDSILS